MRLLALTAALLVAASGFAQDWAKERVDASPRHQEWVSVDNGPRKVKCFVVYPERKEKAPVVIVIHEIMGMSDWVMSVADRLAEYGYIAIAPDLLSGMGPNGGRSDSFPDVGKIREAISGLPSQQVIGDLNAACDYGKRLPSANGKLAVAGFCWGGTQTFLFATARKDLSAALPFYGTGPTDPALLAKIQCPVYGFYGGNDNRVSSTIPESERLMKAAGKTYEPVVYEGAGHGFMRSGEQPDAQAANKEGRNKAWLRMLAILKKL
ncbi:MAG: dienelactone hydrolase family protein [Fimbriimonadaceae bacterium]|nr:dienelactone hydrolase family protein [Fimbriimonadaceae bacterium]